MKKLLIAFFTLLLIPQFAFAGIYTIDPDHSDIGFSVRHLVISNVKGKFNKFSGTIELDNQDKIKNVSVVIETASIDTANVKRDNHLRSPDFFNVEKIPELSLPINPLFSSGD